MAKKYHISFDTKDMPGRIKTVTVQLGTGILRDMNERVRIDLADHPAYPELERYVLNNPSRRPLPR
ncbi:MAG TPA: hypothetical protein PK205_07200 [Promineifilum sp.]|nr:hypothetical protein [Promineifilum sp.]